MKFSCDKCGTKYSVSDDKVRGKHARIRCRKCSHNISVDGTVLVSASNETARTKQKISEKKHKPVRDHDRAGLSVRTARATKERKTKKAGVDSGNKHISDLSESPSNKGRNFKPGRVVSPIRERSIGRVAEPIRDMEAARRSGKSYGAGGGIYGLDKRIGDEIQPDSGADDASEEKLGGWHLVIGREQLGPLDFYDVEKEIRQGRMTRKTYVWREDMEHWKPAGQVAHLSILFGAARAYEEEEQAGEEQEAEEQAGEEQEAEEQAGEEQEAEENYSTYEDSYSSDKDQFEGGHDDSPGDADHESRKKEDLSDDSSGTEESDVGYQQGGEHSQDIESAQGDFVFGNLLDKAEEDAVSSSDIPEQEDESSGLSILDTEPESSYDSFDKALAEEAAKSAASDPFAAFSSSTDTEAPPQETTRMFIIASGVEKQRSPWRIALLVAVIGGLIGSMVFLIGTIGGVDFSGLAPSLDSSRKEAQPWESKGGPTELRDKLLGVSPGIPDIDPGKSTAKQRVTPEQAKRGAREDSVEAEQEFKERLEEERKSVDPEQKKRLAELYSQPDRSAITVRTRPEAEKREAFDDSSEVLIDPEAIYRRLNDVQPAFQSCVEQEMRRNTSFTGIRTEIILTVVPSGVIREVRFEDQSLDRSDVGRCIGRAARTMMLPRFESDEPLQVYFPLVLVAGN